MRECDIILKRGRKGVKGIEIVIERGGVYIFYF